MSGTNHISSSVLLMLKAEWNVASTIDAFTAKFGAVAGMSGSKPTMLQTMLKNGFSSISTQITPRQLMLRCAKAARRADVFAVAATMFDVIVVPMFSPSTSIMPWSMCSTPVVQSVIVIAMMAADDCTQSVSTVPINRKMSEFQNVLALKLLKNAVMLSAYCPATRSEPVAFSVPSPKKRNATPKRKSPSMRRFFMYMSMMPTKNAG